MAQEGGKEAWLHAMLGRKIDFDRLRHPPQWGGAAKLHNVLQGANPIDRFLFDVLAGGDPRPLGQLLDGVPVGGPQAVPVPTEAQWTDGPITTDKTAAFQHYKEWCRDHSFGKPADSTGFWTYLQDG